jgi:DNA-nicking Smr family endonuclease
VYFNYLGEETIMKEAEEILNKVLTLQDAAQAFDISVISLKGGARSGKLVARKVGPMWLTTPEAVVAYKNRPRHPGGRPKKRRVPKNV